MVIRLSVMADDDDDYDFSRLNKSSPIASLSCEDFYIKRVRYLEHFRERNQSSSSTTPSPTTTILSSSSPAPRLSKSANSLNEFQTNFPFDNSASSSSDGSNFVKLGNDMMHLLEKDVQLTKQLLDLNNAIEQLKTCFASSSSSTTTTAASKRKLPKVFSNSSLSSVADDEERKKQLKNVSKEISHVSVNDTDDDDVGDIADDYPDNDELFYSENGQHPKQYFQRQNSALRIPVTRSKRFATVDCSAGSSRRSNNRAKTRSWNGHGQRTSIDHGQRNSHPMYEQENRSNVHSPNSDSCHSAESCSSGTPAENVVAVGSTVLVCHGSQSSFDSGVHSASPEEREEIFV